MALTVNEVIHGRDYHVDARYAGTVPWHGVVTDALGGAEKGLYVVSLAKHPDSREGALPDGPIHLDRVQNWLDVRPGLTLNGTRPSAADLAKYVASWWIPDEHVLYIGRTKDSLRNRVHAYYGTLLGAKGPHAGGSFLKTLGCLDRLHVHLFVGPGDQASEHMALLNFHRALSEESKKRIPAATHQLPFANLRWPEGKSKAAALKGWKGPLS
ncbi:MAG: hypothetical protein IPJ04_16285 [Candidatus Eisenbacteria bacterium]|nr:hypothetical protein [Candidatus Eisenbacteria bacterium]